MNKTKATIRPYFLFSFKIPLQYNSFGNASIDKSNESVIGFDHDLEWEKDNIMNPADIDSDCGETGVGPVSGQDKVGIDGNVRISVAARHNCNKHLFQLFLKKDGSLASMGFDDEGKRTGVENWANLKVE